MDVCVVGLGAIGVLYACALERSTRVQVTAVCRQVLAEPKLYCPPFPSIFPPLLQIQSAEFNRTLLLASDNALLTEIGTFGHVSRSNYPLLCASGPGVDIRSDALGAVKGWKPSRAVRSAEDAADRRYELVLCCFKALQDVTSTPALLGSLLAQTRTFVLVQNGVDIHEQLQRAVPHATIISACAWVDATSIDGGRTVVQTGPERLSFGYHAPPPELAVPFNKDGAILSVKLLGELLQAGGGTPEPTDDINFQRWRKVLWNACFSTLCTMSRGGMADIMSSAIDAQDTTIPAAREIMAEVISVAYASGVRTASLDGAIDFIIDDAIEQYGDAAGTKSPKSNFKPSMLVDLEAGRPIEVEAIVGNVVRAGARLGVITPRLNLVYATLRVVQAQLVRPEER